MNAALKPIKKAVEEAKRKEASLFARTSPVWRAWWYLVRLSCPNCPAYLVYHHVAGKPAFCTELCGFTMRRPTYLAQKTAIVRYLVTGEEKEPLVPYIVKGDLRLPKNCALPEGAVA